ncbi:MAG: FliA/WhiG family RNA polymerase sigma factor [Planctomycetes bacterium]|nr:FliA/WhiG family RNA polymerase sigma factor [Planctomycetota bacterium]
MATVTAAVDDEVVQGWWKEYTKTHSEEIRNRLIEHYLPLVRYTAERLYARLPDEVELDDLISAGTFGLIDAISAFDINRGVKFETYCSQRIRGAILDELRSMDWVPRLVRSRSHKVAEARNALEMELGRKPTDRELAKKMKVSTKEFQKLQRDARTTNVVSLSRKWFESDSNKDVREIDVLEDKRSENPFERFQQKDIKEWITRGLSRAERLIIILYYFEGMTMKEIGQTLDLSESRVSQMHSAILERLKQHLSENRQGDNGL